MQQWFTSLTSYFDASTHMTHIWMHLTYRTRHKGFFSWWCNKGMQHITVHPWLRHLHVHINKHISRDISCSDLQQRHPCLYIRSIVQQFSFTTDFCLLISSTIQFIFHITLRSTIQQFILSMLQWIIWWIKGTPYTWPIWGVIPLFNNTTIQFHNRFLADKFHNTIHFPHYVPQYNNSFCTCSSRYIIWWIKGTPCPILHSLSNIG